MFFIFTIVFCAIVALGFGGAAAYSDFRMLKIPNLYPIAIALSFVPAFLVVGVIAPDNDIFYSAKSHFIAAILVFAITYAMFHFNMMGGGDAKLLSAFALWVGLSGLIPFLFIMAMMGGVLAAITLVVHKWKPLTKFGGSLWLENAQAGKKQVPYGIAIFCGAIFAFWNAGYIELVTLIDFAAAQQP